MLRLLLMEYTRVNREFPIAFVWVLQALQGVVYRSVHNDLLTLSCLLFYEHLKVFIAFLITLYTYKI